MSSSYYASRRMVDTSSSATWARNRNAVRHSSRVMLGNASHTIICILLVLVIGFFYVAQTSKITNYDVSIAEIDSEIAELEAQRDALVVETAKITAAASDVDLNTVASTMVDAYSSDFVKD